MNSRNRLSTRHSGMTLIEVLVAILIFSFGLLGFVGLQARAITFSSSAEDSNRAALLASEMATTAVLSGSLANVPASAVAAWQARVADPTIAGLPNAVATYAASGVITITWQAPSASGSANSTNKYVTQVFIP